MKTGRQQPKASLPPVSTIYPGLQPTMP